MFKNYILLLALGFSGFAASATDLPWDVHSVQVHRVENGSMPIELQGINDCAGFSTSMDITGIGLGDIITVGEKVWQIVAAGKPVVSLKTPTVSALPGGLSCWTDLAGWQAPHLQTYEVSYKNMLGIEVVKFRFRLQFTYGGNHAGIGHYLANVTVVPAELNVNWGYNFDASIVVDQAVNVGTAQDPMAGIGLTLKWTVKTVLSESDNSFNFFVQGDGQSTAVN